MPMELELKYRAETAAALTSLLADPSISSVMAQAPREISMCTRYYDTPDRALSARKWTLRLRLEDDCAIAAFKTSEDDDGPLSRRGEWQVRCESVEEAIPALVAQGAPAALRELTRGGVTLICGAEFTRLMTRLWLAGGTEAELAVDVGVLTGGGRVRELREVELELLQGNEEAMCLLMAELAKRHGLTPEPKSKFVRAMELV